jgi:glutathione S-transferase
MNSDRHVVFFHCPNSRAAGVRILLEELGADYEMRVLSLKAGQQRAPDYLAVNPMGKVPAIVHGEALVTEQAAVYMYMADLYPEAGLAPDLQDPLRGPYLRWMVFYGSCVEPAVVDRAFKCEPVHVSTCPYGDFDTMYQTVVDQLGKGPYMLGERFTAVDLLWGTSLNWLLTFKLLPESAVLTAYVERVMSRPAVQRAVAADAALVKQMEA